MPGESKDAATVSGRMLIVAEHTDDALTRFVEACRAAGWPLEEAPDVYAAMGRLANARPGEYTRVVVDSRTLDETELTFLDLAPRYFAGVKVNELAEFVQGNGIARRSPVAESGAPPDQPRTPPLRSAGTAPVEIASEAPRPADPQAARRHTERVTLQAMSDQGPRQAPTPAQPVPPPRPAAQAPGAEESFREPELPDDGIPMGLDQEFGDPADHAVILGRIGPGAESQGHSAAPATNPNRAQEPSLHDAVRMRMDAAFGARRVQRVPPGGAAPSHPPAGAAPRDADDLGAVLSQEELAALLNPEDLNGGGQT